MDERTAKKIVVLGVLLKSLERSVSLTLGRGMGAAVEEAAKIAAGLRTGLEGHDTRLEQAQLDFLREVALQVHGEPPKVIPFPAPRKKTWRDPFDFWRSLENSSADERESCAVRLAAVMTLGGSLFKSAERRSPLECPMDAAELRRSAAKAAKAYKGPFRRELISEIAELFRLSAPMFNDGVGMTEKMYRELAEANALVRACQEKIGRFSDENLPHRISNYVRLEQENIRRDHPEERDACRVKLEIIMRLLGEARAFVLKMAA